MVLRASFLLLLTFGVLLLVSYGSSYESSHYEYPHPDTQAYEQTQAHDQLYDYSHHDSRAYDYSYGDEAYQTSSYSDNYWSPRYYGHRYAQPRSLWSRARSMMPRLADVAAETTSALLLPGLAILTIAMLWPEYKHIRTKRETDGMDETTDRTQLLLEHLTRVYTAAAESDQCLQRVACELGATAATLDPNHRHLVLKLVGAAAPAKYSNLLSRFKGGVKKADSCQQHGCPLMDN